MSILIKGMSKPTDCGLCPFEDFGYCAAKGERNTSEKGIDDDCPLVEIKDMTNEEFDSILARLIADRKTENSSEIPNNCEDESQIDNLVTAIANEAYCRTCKHLLDEDCDCDIVFTGYEPKDEPQTYKKWETKHTEIPTTITTCVSVPLASLEDEPQIERSRNGREDNSQGL